MHWPRVVVGAVSMVAVVAFAPPADAVVVNASDSGWYQQSGFHDPDNLNWIAGQCSICDVPGLGEYRNFFVFDLSGVGHVSSAVLTILEPENGFFSPDPSESYSVFDVSTPVASLTNGTGGTAAFADLGSGTSFGSVVMSHANEGTLVSIVFNAAGVAAINHSLGGLFAVGGAVTTLAGSSDQWVFGFSGAGSQERS